MRNKTLKRLEEIHKELSRIMQMDGLVYRYEITPKQAEEAQGWLNVAMQAVNHAHVVLER